MYGSVTMLQLWYYALHAGWNAELNVRVGFFNELSIIASSCL